MSDKRLTSRDYKRPRRGQFGLELARWRELGIGLAAGLCVAGMVYVADHRASDAAPAERPVPRHAGPVAANTAGAAADADVDAEGAGAGAGTPAEGKYDFYQMLPKFEVVVPEKERGTRVAPAAQIDRPGVYFLQAGSYRDNNVAERIRAQLGKLGIEATVQRVAVDTDVWHRVRIGPIRDLGKLNRLRAQLREADLDALVIRVDD
ncbi:MAG TPA: SPOR domain-containing protein [Steroidobacteraceae bacterium]